MVKKTTIKKTVAKKSENLSFEAAIAELQAIVESMEKGDISLEESLQAFERGVELTRNCQNELHNAEQKIRILSENHQLENWTDSSVESE